MQPAPQPLDLRAGACIQLNSREPTSYDFVHGNPLHEFKRQQHVDPASSSLSRQSEQKNLNYVQSSCLTHLSFGAENTHTTARQLLTGVAGKSNVYMQIEAVSFGLRVPSCSSFSTDLIQTPTPPVER